MGENNVRARNGSKKFTVNRWLLHLSVLSKTKLIAHSFNDLYSLKLHYFIKHLIDGGGGHRSRVAGLSLER